jgi:hypothetical protein
MLCVEWEKQKITSKEAFRAMGEMMIPENQKHLEELSEKILSKEVPETETNKDIDEAFWNATHQED